MPRFDRYILRELLAVFGFFALVLVGVYWINRAVGLFDQLIGDGQSARMFFEYSALALPNVIKLLLPAAAFIAVLYGGNRLMGDSELVVMQATGFSPFRLARPVAVFGLVVVVMMLLLTNILVPLARGAADAQRATMSENITAHFLQSGQFTHPTSGVTFYIREISPTGQLLDLFLSDDRNPARRITYTASRALFLRGANGPKLLMFDGMAQEFDGTDQRLSVTRFADFTYDLGALLTHAISGRADPGALATRDLLWPSPAIMAATQNTRRALLYEGNARFGDPLMALAAALVGFAALMQGSYSRMGLWRQIGLAVGLIILMQAVTTVAASRGPRVPLGYLMAYLAPLLGLVTAAALLAWASRHRRGLPGGHAESPEGSPA